MIGAFLPHEVVPFFAWAPSRHARPHLTLGRILSWQHHGHDPPRPHLDSTATIMANTDYRINTSSLVPHDYMNFSLNYCEQRVQDALCALSSSNNGCMPEPARHMRLLANSLPHASLFAMSPSPQVRCSCALEHFALQPGIFADICTSSFLCHIRFKSKAGARTGGAAEGSARRASR